MSEPIVLPVKACTHLVGDACDCLTPAQASAEMAQLGRERPPIVIGTGPAAEAAIRRANAENPLLVAMRAAAINHYDSKGLPR